MDDWRQNVRWLFAAGRTPALYRSWHQRCAARQIKCDRLDLGSWHKVTAGKWTIRLDLAIARSNEPVVLVTHDVASYAVIWWAAFASPERRRQIAAAILIAPPDLQSSSVGDHIAGLAPFPCTPLPFPTKIVASSSDPDASLEFSEHLAEKLGATFQNLGCAGRLTGFLRANDWEKGIEYMLARPSTHAQLLLTRQPTI